jgi:hypothetical protein
MTKVSVCLNTTVEWELDQGNGLLRETGNSKSRWIEAVWCGTEIVHNSSAYRYDTSLVHWNRREWKHCTDNFI